MVVGWLFIDTGWAVGLIPNKDTGRKAGSSALRWTQLHTQALASAFSARVGLPAFSFLSHRAPDTTNNGKAPQTAGLTPECVDYHVHWPQTPRLSTAGEFPNLIICVFRNFCSLAS